MAMIAVGVSEAKDTPQRTVTGTVVADGATPLTTVRVTVLKSNGEPRDDCAPVTTDQSGKFNVQMSAAIKNFRVAFVDFSKKHWPKDYRPKDFGPNPLDLGRIELRSVSEVLTTDERGQVDRLRLNLINSQPDLAEILTATLRENRLTEAGEPLQYAEKTGFWERLNPFAWKKNVERQSEPIGDRLSELDELTASNRKMIQDVDSRAQEGIRLTSAKANEADQHAYEASNKAQTAHEAATQANNRLATVEQAVNNLDAYKTSTEVEITFRHRETELSKNAKLVLDDMAKELNDKKGYIVEVQGFSSTVGQSGIAISQKIADSVVRYLVQNHQIPVYRIFVIGMGNVSSATGTPGNKAIVTVMKSDQ